MSPQALEQVVASQINRLTGLRFQWLPFPPILEEQFERDTSARRCARLWLEGLLATVLFDLFLVGDHFLSSRGFARAAIVRLGVVTPLALAISISMRHRPNRIFREASIAAVACIAGLTHLYLEADAGSVASAYAQFGILAVVLFVNTQMRLRFTFALATTLVMIAGDLTFLANDRYLGRNEKIFGLLLTLCTTAVTLISNYSSNREERLNYLLCLRGDILVNTLSQSNQKLTRLAEVDELTGIANRRAFDVRFQEVWDATVASGSSLSVILVDVDHFKQTNDTYGHLHGDKVLRRTAHLLTEALRVKGDFVARFGGEEFVILLPDTTQASAMIVAERLRMLVQVAGSPALDSLTPNLHPSSITVSCGVTSVRPTATGNPQAMLGAADEALYEAKRQGRNRVWCSSYPA